nr:hypothetical protein [Tanacetum cinerariifolium]
MDGRAIGAGEAAGAGVFLRRRAGGRRWLGAALRRRKHGPARYRGRDGELPPGRVRLFGPPRANPGIAPSR